MSTIDVSNAIRRGAEPAQMKEKNKYCLIYLAGVVIASPTAIGQRNVMPSAIGYSASDYY